MKASDLANDIIFDLYIYYNISCYDAAHHELTIRERLLFVRLNKGLK